MTTLAPERYLDHIRSESRRFREVLADCDPAARVPGCPDWDAAEAHVTSDHFRKARVDLPQYVQETPLVRNVLMEGDHWDTLGEFEIS